MTRDIDWKAIDHRILAALDLNAEAEELGIRFSAARPTSNGWRECYAFDRDEKNPSAAICVAGTNGSNGLLGRYSDRAGGDKAIGFFELAARKGRFSNWQEARAHYAAKAGIELPGKTHREKARKLLDCIVRKPTAETNAAVASWANTKKGVTAEAALKAGAYSGMWPAKAPENKRHEVIVFPAYDPGDWTTPVALLMYRADGKDFPAIHDGPRERKTHLVGGSVDGLIIVGTVAELKAATTVWKTEGTTDALALAAVLPIGHIAITNACGAGSFPGHLATPFADKAVNVLHDADQAGETGARKGVVPACVPVAAEVRHVRLPYEVSANHGKDVRDWLNEGGTFDQLQALADAAEVEKLDTDNIDTRTEIVVTPEEIVVNNAAIKALTTDNDVYQRGGVLVHVIRDDGRKKKGIKRVAGTPRIVELLNPLLSERLGTVAKFIRERATENGVTRSRTTPPARCVNAIAARGQWEGIRYLEGVSGCPMLRDDGTVASAAGYDDGTGLLIFPTAEFPSVPLHPSAAAIRLARQALEEIVTDFPFEKPEHQAAWIAFALTPFARHAFDGPTPLFLVDANTRGSGKSKLVDGVSILATGLEMPRTSYSDSDAEMRKVITSLALSGDSMVMLDDIGRELGGDALNAALTATRWRDRLLGGNKTYDGPLTVLWCGTGNNVTIVGDTIRRVLHIRLNSPLENPEERTGFRHPDLLRWLRAERPRLVTAALTILRGYCAAGRPCQNLPPWGSFEDWSDLVRSAVVWADWPDPAATRTELVSRSDRDAAALRAFIEAFAHFADRPPGFTGSQMMRKLCADQGDPGDNLRAAIQELCPSNTEMPSTRSLGNRLRRLRGRVVAGRIIASIDRSGTQSWFIDNASAAGSTGSTCSTASPHRARVGEGIGGGEANSLGLAQEQVEQVDPDDPPSDLTPEQEAETDKFMDS